MTNYVRRKYRMRRYARAHKIAEPRGFRPWVMGWGRPAAALLKLIQKHADLVTTGSWNVEVQDLLFPPSFGRMVVKIARGELGVTEHPAGSNDGTRVHVYQSVTGVYKQPWCASFVCWCLHEAARSSGKTVRFAPLPAWVPSWTQMIRAGDRGWRRVEPSEARAGDVVTLWGSQHVELVTGRDDGHLLCIGGNTSPEGQNANGGMVARTKRHKSEVTVIGRLR